MGADESPGFTPSVTPGSVWVRQDGHRIGVSRVDEQGRVVWYQRDESINPETVYFPNGGWQDTVSQLVKHMMPLPKFLARFSHVRESIEG
jgi:formylmethanofuran dehydrogenase subunit D